MKTIFKFSVIALSALLIVTSCKKDDDDKKPDDSKGPAFSSKTPEEHKASIEQAGIEFINQLKGLETTVAMEAMENLADLMDESKSYTKSIVTSVAGLKSGKKSNLKALLQSPLREEIEEMAVILTWDPSIGDFVETATNELMVKVLFPSKNSTTNNCEFRLTFELTSINDQYLETNEAPSKISAFLKVGSTTAMSMTSNFAYTSDGLPSSISSEITIDTYKWAVSASQSTSSVGYTYSFTKGATTLMGSGFQVNGNLNTTDIENFVERVENMEAYVSGTATEAGTYVRSVSMHYQIMDIRLAGNANTQNFAKAIDPYLVQVDNDQITNEQFESQLVTLINTHANVYLMYQSVNQKIADAELYLTSRVDYWGDTYNAPNVRFNFGPNTTPVDVEVYFSEGFESLESEMADFAEYITSLFESLDFYNGDDGHDDWYYEEEYITSY